MTRNVFCAALILFDRQEADLLKSMVNCDMLYTQKNGDKADEKAIVLCVQHGQRLRGAEVQRWRYGRY